jgi:hypothetical protein
MKNLNQDETVVMRAIGYAFTLFYVVELLASIKVQGKVFFFGPEFGWNIFDTTIVLAALFELGIKATGAPMVNASFLRILRFFKLSRVLRMFSALRMVKEVRIMVDALSGCFSLFVFCSVMMMIFLSVFAVFFVQAFASLLEDQSKDMDNEALTAINTHFGTVGTTMITLFMTCTGGNDWVEYYQDVQELALPYHVLFICFVLFYGIAFFNVITGVFCEKAMSLATPTTRELMIARTDKTHRDSKELLALIGHFHPGSSCITKEDFDKFLENDDVELFFEVRGLKVPTARKFFSVLCDLHDTDRLDLATLVSSLVKMDGVASFIDAHCLHARQLHALAQIKAAHATQSQQSRAQHEAVDRAHNNLLEQLASRMPARNTPRSPGVGVGSPLMSIASENGTSVAAENEIIEAPNRFNERQRSLLAGRMVKVASGDCDEQNSFGFFQLDV